MIVACCSVTQSCLTLRPHGLEHARLLSSWNSPGKNTGADSHFLLQGIFLTQRSNLRLLHLQVGSLPLSSSSIQWNSRQALQKWDMTKYTGAKVVQYMMANRKIKSKLHNSKLNIWRRQWHPTPVLLPGKYHGQRSLVGCSPWGR